MCPALEADALPRDHQAVGVRGVWLASWCVADLASCHLAAPQPKVINPFRCGNISRSPCSVARVSGRCNILSGKRRPSS